MTRITMPADHFRALQCFGGATNDRDRMDAIYFNAEPAGVVAYATNGHAAIRIVLHENDAVTFEGDMPEQIAVAFPSRAFRKVQRSLGPTVAIEFDPDQNGSIIADIEQFSDNGERQSARTVHDYGYLDTLPILFNESIAKINGQKWENVAMSVAMMKRLVECANIMSSHPQEVVEFVQIAEDMFLYYMPAHDHIQIIAMRCRAASDHISAWYSRNPIKED